MPLLRLTPVGIDPERIAGLLPAAPAVPRQTGAAQQGGSGIERHAGVRGLGAGAAAADGELSGGVALCGQNGDGVLARRQCLEVHGLQIDLDAALLGDVVGLVKGLAVHLHAPEAAEGGGAPEGQTIDAAAVIGGGEGVRSRQQRGDGDAAGRGVVPPRRGGAVLRFDRVYLILVDVQIFIDRPGSGFLQGTRIAH